MGEQNATDTDEGKRLPARTMSGHSIRQKYDIDLIRLCMKLW
jgi:hypothetical protein